MALTRIWSAFVIISIIVASYKCFVGGDRQIFSRMVIGKADDPYDSVYYFMTGNPEKSGIVSSESFTRSNSNYGYAKTDSIQKASILLTDDVKSESVSIIKKTNPSISVITYRQLQGRMVKHVDGIIEACKTAVTISIGLIGIMAMFMGFMSIAEKAGGIRLLSKIMWPFFSRLFPEVPKGHPSLGHMAMNFSANLLGLDNAATPFGVRTMESLQEINPSKDTASNAQIMFLCLHASGFTLVPVSIIAVRAALKAHNPTDIFIPCMIATFTATIAAMLIVSFKQKINLLKPVIVAWVGGISIVIVSLILYLTSLGTDRMLVFSGALGNGILLLILLLIVLGGLYKKINLFDAFIEGAKGGFETAIRIIPYMVAILAATSLLRTSGVFDEVINAMKSFFAALGADTRFVDGLPTAIIRPFSAGGSRGMMVDAIKTFGPDAFGSRLSGILQGSSDTTFYVVAVYFGAVSIKNTRYAIPCMLLADLVGVLTSIFMCYLFFGNTG